MGEKKYKGKWPSTLTLCKMSNQLATSRQHKSLVLNIHFCCMCNWCSTKHNKKYNLIFFLNIILNLILKIWNHQAHTSTCISVTPVTLLMKKSYDDYVNVHLLYNTQPYMCKWNRIWKKFDLNVNSQPWDHKGQPNSVISKCIIISKLYIIVYTLFRLTKLFLLCV